MSKRLAVAVECEYCGTSFHPWPPRPGRNPGGRFCSRTCHMRSVNTPEHNAQIARDTADKRSERARAEWDGKVKPTTYRKLHSRHEHRVVAEKKLGRPLQRGEIVHHKNENKHDNADDNVEVVPSQSEHARRHLEEARRDGRIIYVNGKWQRGGDN